jgi:Phosphopantetheine attachment site
MRIGMTEGPTGLVTIIAKEMGDVLSRVPLDPGDDFFLCGGDSVLAVTLITRLAERYAVPDDKAADRFRSALLMEVFEDATPVALAAIVEREAQ